MKHLRVLLINPQNSVPLKSNFTVNIFQPIGLAYVASILEKNNYPVEILDALALGFDKEKIVGNKKIIGLNYNEIRKKVVDYNPDVVGISCPFSFQSHEAHIVAKIVKKVNSNIIIFAGGAHATIQPEEILGDNNFDFVVRGEGEYTTVELLKAIEKHTSTKSIKNLSFRNNRGKIIHNIRGEPIMNLDNLPLPARHLLPMEKYFQAAKTGRVIEGMLSYGSRRTSIFTSRGCPFTCTFCSVHLTMTRTWRYRSPENVLSEIKECVTKYGIRYFDILDDNFTLDPNRAKQICRLIIKNRLKIQWSTPNGIRADRVDEELIKLMKKAGCIQIKVAVESGSKRVLQNIVKKNLDLEMVKKTVSLCKKNHLSVEAFFIIGFPEETIADIHKTIAFAKELRKLGCGYCYFFTATPYFGTEMYDNAIKNGYLDQSKYRLDKILITDDTLLFNSPNYTHEELRNLSKLAVRINPPITKIRLISGLKILIVDPKRIIRYALIYLKYFLP